MNYPSLKVCGNPDKNAGDQVLYSLTGGNIVIHEYEMGDVPYFNVNITDYNVQYVFVPNVNVKSYSSIRDSYCLKMGISIPRHYRLKYGVSPYDVLMDVYKTMKKENLSEISGMNFLQYNEGMCKESVFETLLQKYPLEEYISAYRPMNGSSAALLVTDKISEFMKDPHYPELQRYSEVIVATAGASYPSRVPELQIPRIRQFSLYVNDKKDGRILSEKNRCVVIECPNEDPRCFKSWPAVTLSMADIISERVDDGYVKVDLSEENIYYDFPPLEPLTVPWRVEVKVNGVITNNVKLTNFTVQLSNGSTKSINQKGEFNLTGQENLFSPKEISYNNDDYWIVNQFLNPSTHCFTVYMKKKAPMSPPTRGSNADSGAEHHRDNDNKQKVLIVLPPKAFADNGKDHSGNIKLYPNGWGGEKDYHYKTVKFEPKWENADEDEVELWFSEVMLPSCSHLNNGKMYISVETKKAIYEGPGEMEHKNQYQRSNRPEIKSDAERYLDLGKVKWKSNSFLKRHCMQIIYSFMLLLVFALGIAMGYKGYELINPPAPPVSVEDVRNGFVFVGQYSCLDNDSVTFEEIDSLYATMNDLSDEVRNYLPDWELMGKRTEAYYKIVEKIRSTPNCDQSFINELRFALEPTKAYYGDKDDLPPNLDYCRYLYKLNKYGGSDDKLKQAQDKFLDKKKKGEINSFTDIKSITEGLESEPITTLSSQQSGVQSAASGGRGSGSNNSNSQSTSSTTELIDDRTN